MGWILDSLSWALLVTGGAFSLVSGIGLLRFPDFYTRAHAAGIADTLGIGLVLAGLMLQADAWLTVVKLALIILILFFSTPTAIHAIAQAAFSHGVTPNADDRDPDDLRGPAPPPEAGTETPAG